MSVLFTEQDIALSVSSGESIREVLDDWRVNASSRLETYGKGMENVLTTTTRFSRLESLEQVEALNKWRVKAFQHAEHIKTHPELFLPLVNSTSESVTVKSHGISSAWTISNIGYLGVNFQALERVLGTVAERIDGTVLGYRGLSYRFRDEHLSEDYLSDANKPLLQRAMWLAKRDVIMESRGSAVEIVKPTGHGFIMLNLFHMSEGYDLPVQQAYIIAQLLNRMDKHTLNTNSLRAYRSRVLALQAQNMSSDAVMRRQVAAKNFSNYWDNMKTRQRGKMPTEDVAAEVWDTIPLLGTGTESSRTWGIEVETVRADQTSRPRGWSDVYDGSLPDGGCDCNCDDCCDGEHCGDTDYCASGSESREFVSPVLRHWNSSGLQQLCSDLGDDEESTAPGIHVHVGADDVTVMDVARLLFAYGVVAPLIKPLYHRQSFGYCNEMDGGNVQWWMGQVKSYLRDNGELPNPRYICESQPASRYQDVNLHSLSKHGTIEFRSMGPFYNYNHLVRWAWFVREMVNVSKLGLDQSVWTSCNTLNDVISVLRKYGNELPLDKQQDVAIECLTSDEE